MKAIHYKPFHRSFQQFLSDCETLVEVAVSKEFSKEESFVMLLGAKYLEGIAKSAILAFEMDIFFDAKDQEARQNLADVKDCLACITRIIERMRANMLIAEINLN